MSDAIVSLKKVCVRLNGMPVLEDITCSVAPNDFLAVIGPNGGGKTTLLKVILGLIEPDSGEVRVFGKSPRLGRKDIGYLSQHTVYDPNFPISVFEAILMGRYRGILRRYSREDREAADEALENVGLFDVRNRQIGRLSGQPGDYPLHIGPVPRTLKIHHCTGIAPCQIRHQKPPWDYVDLGQTGGKAVPSK